MNYLKRMQTLFLRKYRRLKGMQSVSTRNNEFEKMEFEGNSDLNGVTGRGSRPNVSDVGQKMLVYVDHRIFYSLYSKILYILEELFTINRMASRTYI